MKNLAKNFVIDIEPISRRLHLSQEKNLYQNLIDSGIQIRTLCGGKGTCGKCKILFQKGEKYFNDPTPSEIDLIGYSEILNGWRLACQSKIDKKLINSKEEKIPEIVILLPEESLIENFKILTSGDKKPVNLIPNIKKVYLKVKKPTLDSPIPDFERLILALKSTEEIIQENNFEIEFEVLKELPEILRENNNEITITLSNDKRIIACEPGNTLNKNFGIAFDIGTTTIVGYLINLYDNKVYSVASALNPQTAYGEDVVSRITYIKNNDDGLEKLNSSVIKALNNIILKTCDNASIEPSQIYEASIVGNSVMHHIFLGLNPISIGLSPYVPVIKRELNIKPKRLNLNIFNRGNVYILPLIAGFVGADTIGVILSSEIDQETKLTLAIDIGTNGEIIIGNRNVLATGSCAAGSALEGAHIKDGMRAAGGAIDSIKINPKTFNVLYTTIKNKKPLGICGSGLIDAVAEMLKSKIITRSGNFNKNLFDHERFIRKGKNIEFVLATKGETQLRREISLSQKDIREIQMAKAAFFSGTRLIINYLNNKYNSDYEIKQIFLAGAFGNYINKESAKFIGMIPDISPSKIFQIGNAAGIGAQYCLINKNFRKKAHNLFKKIEYVEIALEKDFQREFAEAMYFPHLNLDLFPSLEHYKSIPKR